MRIKSFFADSVQEAIEKARAEIGPEAMLMNSKQTELELRVLGSVEVVFGVPDESPSPKPRLPKPELAKQPEDTKPSIEAAAADLFPVSSTNLAREMVELRLQIEGVKRSMHRQQRSSGPSTSTHSSTAENICARLVLSGLSEDLAQEIAESVELQVFAESRSGSHSQRQFELDPLQATEVALSAELERRFLVDPCLGVNGASKTTVLFVGAPGAGKTTALFKLGLRFGVQRRLPLHILSLDTRRVGGWETLASYAQIAGIGFDAVHSLKALDPMLDELADKELVLIDSPGFGPADEDDLNELGRWLDCSPGLDVQLVVPGTLRSSVLIRTLGRFDRLKPKKLILTRVDELENVGALLDVSIRSRLPLSFISSGQVIPEDIEEACKSDLLARFNPGRHYDPQLNAA